MKKLNKTFIKGMKANKLSPFSITILNNALLWIISTFWLQCRLWIQSMVFCTTGLLKVQLKGRTGGLFPFTESCAFYFSFEFAVVRCCSRLKIKWNLCFYIWNNFNLFNWIKYKIYLFYFIPFCYIILFLYKKETISVKFTKKCNFGSLFNIFSLIN